MRLFGWDEDDDCGFFFGFGAEEADDDDGAAAWRFFLKLDADEAEEEGCAGALRFLSGSNCNNLIEIIYESILNENVTKIECNVFVKTKYFSTR